MRAAQVESLGMINIVQKPIPDPGDDSILVKVISCAICGSDVRIFRKGDHRAKYPIVLGHEIAGIVEEVGKNVIGISTGDRVCVAPGHGCGKCRYCLAGQSNVCINPHPSIGYASDGGFSEYMIPPPNVVNLGFVNPIPENVSMNDATMSELLACCLNAQENTPVHEGDVVLIIGAGPAGCMHIELSKLRGASKVLITQRSVKRLELAKRFEPDRVIASSQENLVDAVMDETNGIGADVVFVCAPSKEAQEQAVMLSAPRGRVNFFGGLPKENKFITIDANLIHYKEISIGGASSSLARLNQEALTLISQGNINASKYITHTFPLKNIMSGFGIIENRNGIKIVINPEDNS